jgi:chemotaxis regulatin CheY-phosphate phosphatase CheZ
MKHAQYISELEALRAEMIKRVGVIDGLTTDTRHNLAILGPVAQLQHAINDCVGSINHVVTLLNSDARRSKRKRST